jgi:hypothetical protein
MKRVITIGTLIICTTCLAQGQDIAGDWQGTLNAGTRQLHLVLHVTKDTDSKLKASLDSVDQDARGIPVSAISLKNSKLKFSVDKINASYQGKLSQDATEISGTWSQGGGYLDLDSKRSCSGEVNLILLRLPTLMVRGWQKWMAAAADYGSSFTSSRQLMA